MIDWIKITLKNSHTTNELGKSRRDINMCLDNAAASVQHEPWKLYI